jgi:periplasmic protein TonB
MFEELVVSGKTKPTSQRWTMVVSGILEVLFIFILLLIPLYFTDALPSNLMQSIILVAPPPPPAPPPPAAVAAVVVHHAPHLMQNNQLVAPRIIPREVRIIHEEPEPPDNFGTAGGVVGGVPGGSLTGVIGGVIGGVSTHNNAPPPPPPPTPKRIIVGGNVIAAKLLNRTTPSYPPLARQTHTQGDVLLHAIIGKDGSIQQLEAVSGHPLLVQAALDAVKLWRYQPTLLNGQPVEVETTISVQFHLAE